LKLKKTAEIDKFLWKGAQITQEAGDRFGYGLMLEQIALAAWARGDFTSAGQLFDSSVELFREIGDAWYLSRVLTSWGYFKQSLGDLAHASEFFKQAIRLSLDARAFLVALNALVGLAGVYAQEDKTVSALEIAIHVNLHPASTEDARSNAKLIQHNMESLLSPDEVEAAHQRAQNDTLEEFARFHL
jgi:tetratricopeptide (TPR) repeat protein